ncbi:MAG: sodium/substrate symporter small subunit [Pseudomonadota bacterium]
MDEPAAYEHHDRRVLWLKAGLLALWAAASFGVCYFARALDFTVGSWQFSYWFAAQGALLVFIAIVAFYAWAMARLDPEEPSAEEESAGG